MASNAQVSTSKKDTNQANRSQLPPPQQEQNQKGQNQKQFNFEQKCFLMHHANYCTDFETLREMLNMQFNTEHTLDSIDYILNECGDEEFLQLTETAERYKKWYTEHPISPVCPIFLLGSRAMRTELRAYLAYHHRHGMGPADLNNYFNLTFPTETRDSRQIAAQLTWFTMKPQRYASLYNFSVRYPWHPKYKPVSSSSAARARLDKGKQKALEYANNQAAVATQARVIKQAPPRKSLICDTDSCPPTASTPNLKKNRWQLRVSSLSKSSAYTTSRYGFIPAHGQIESTLICWATSSRALVSP